jgi:hypothetical protein
LERNKSIRAYEVEIKIYGFTHQNLFFLHRIFEQTNKS